jgi:hypothetical protein
MCRSSSPSANPIPVRAVRRPYLHLDLDCLGTARKAAGNNAAAIKCVLSEQRQINVKKCAQSSLPTALCEKFGILNRKAKERSLRFWELAGIFSLSRKPGKNPLVEFVQPLRIAELASVRGQHPHALQ